MLYLKWKKTKNSGTPDPTYVAAVMGVTEYSGYLHCIVLFLPDSRLHSTLRKHYTSYRAKGCFRQAVGERRNVVGPLIPLLLTRQNR